MGCGSSKIKDDEEQGKKNEVFIEQCYFNNYPDKIQFYEEDMKDNNILKLREEWKIK